MTKATGQNRHFLFLQGPHGPFFNRLASLMRATGATILRVGFNAGDEFFWQDQDRYVAFQDDIANWPGFLKQLLVSRGITDIVLYGDTRPVHATAIKLANQMDLTTHVFGEGYLRPFWETYERSGSNGHSRLMDMSVHQMQRQLSKSNRDQPQAPDHWGDMREHIFYGAAYHWLILFWNQRYRQFAAHRNISVAREFRLYLRKLALRPAH